MPSGWKGNRRFGVALSMRHGLEWSIHLRAQRPTYERWGPRLCSWWGTAWFAFDVAWRLELHFKKMCTSLGRTITLKTNSVAFSSVRWPFVRTPQYPFTRHTLKKTRTNGLIAFLLKHRRAQKKTEKRDKIDEWRKENNDTQLYYVWVWWWRN